MKTITIEATDVNGNYAKETADFNIIDTPDVEFYDMPTSIFLHDGESKTVQGKIRDDYTSLENLVMNVSCDNADVSLVKQSGDLFDIVINANQGYIGDSQISVYAADDEGNENTYNIPLTITAEPNLSLIHI